MVAVRIPGAEQIADIAPARDPGVTASPDDFGAQIGTSTAHFGDALSSLGAHLYQKRQAAEDQTYEQTYNVNVAPRMAQGEYQARKDYPDGGPEYIAASQAAAKGAHQGTIDDLAARGITPSDGARRRVDTAFAGRDMNTRVGAVTYDNNSQIEKLKTVTNGNIDSLSSQVMAGTMDVDEALTQADAITGSSGHLYTGGALEKFKKDARTTIQQAAVDHAWAAKDAPRARELDTRFFGGTPQPGQAKVDTLTQRESGGDPTLVNKLGYAGAYQFGAPRLETLGVYTPGKNENLDSWSKTAWNAPGKWTGTFKIEGFPEVKSLKDFLADPEAQKAVYQNHIVSMDEESTAKGLDKYVGQTVAGVEITRDGIRNMSHLGGSGGAAKFLDSGGQYNPADANGTKLSDYAKMGAKSAVAENPNVARSLANRNKIDSMDGVNRIETTDAIKDDLASMSATGIGDGTLTADRIIKSLGPNAAADWQTARARAKEFHTQTQDFPTLPAEQINARIKSLAAKPGQDEYVAQDALHTAAIKKADALMELRKKDPAESVSDDPEVKRAIGNYDPKDPSTTKAIITARLAAQRRAEIAAPSPIPLDETQRLLKPINEAVQMEDLDRTKGGPSRVVLAQQKLVKDLKEKYGTYADDVMREVIGQAANSRDRVSLADAAGKVMSSLINGTVPGAKPVKIMKVTAENNVAEKAMSIGKMSDAMWPADAYSYTPAAPPPKTPSAKSIQILLAAPANDQARLAGLFDKQFGVGSAQKLLNQKAAPTGTVTVDDSGESYTP